MNLVWKEFRESWPLVLLGFFVIVFYALWPALSALKFAYDYGWGQGLYSSGSAILLFMATVLGVTAYAVEEEDGTLLPLFAKPIPTNDIMATKIGVRLGLLLIAVILFGVLQLITGAWPIEWGIPAPDIFGRWVGTVMLIVVGFGLGLYFGRTRKEQTASLMAALLVFLLGYAILNFTPLYAAFQNEEGPTNIAWIRGIALPGLVGVSFILVTIFMPPERSRMVSRPLAVLIGLAVYAGVFWSLSLVPTSSIWSHPSTLDEYVAMRFGSQQKAWDAFQKLVLPWDGEDEGGRIVTWLINRTSARRWEYEYGPNWDRTALLDPLTTRSDWVRTVPRENPVTYLQGGSESFILDHRGPGWARWVLANSSTPGTPVHIKMLALHAAGASRDSTIIADMKPYLSPEEPLPVRWMAGMMTYALGGDGGRATLVDVMPSAGPRILRTYMFSFLDRDMEATEEEVGDLFRTWIHAGYEFERTERRGDQAELINTRMRLAAHWLQRHSTSSDEPYARMVEWVNKHRWVDGPKTLAEADIWEWKNEWESRGRSPDWFYADARGRMDDLKAGVARYRELQSMRRNSRAWREETGEWRTAYGRSLNRFVDDINRLLQQRDVRAVELWKASRAFTRDSETAAYLLLYGGDRMFPLLPELGEPGLQLLREIAEDPQAETTQRIQAALILVDHGEERFSQDALQLWDLYGSNREGYWQSEVLAAYLTLIERGHLQFITPILDEANKGIEGSHRRWSNYAPGFGVPEWNSAIPKILAEATGKDFGWDLKAWTTWWEREGSKSSVGDNQ